MPTLSSSLSSGNRNLYLFLSILLCLPMGCQETDPDDKTQVSTVAAQTQDDAKIISPDFNFAEIASSSGIDFVFKNGAEGEKWMPESMLGGLAFFDYDNDSDPDLIAVSGTDWKSYKNHKGSRTIALFRNDGEKGFVDISEQSGLNFNGYGMGVAIGDYDGDGWNDIYITALGKNSLYRNIHGAKFEEVTNASGVGGRQDAWSIAAVFFDPDRDGDMDLLVCNYLLWNKKVDARANEEINGIARAYGGPNFFAGDQPFFFRNNGKGKFTEESASAGLHVYEADHKANVGKPLGILPIDLNHDGYMDILIANDKVRKFAFINDKKGGFVEQGEAIGIAYNSKGEATAGMGIDAAWLGADLELNIAIGNFSGEMTSIFRLDEKNFIFTDDAPVTGIGPASRSVLTFGVLYADLDLDGRQDFIEVNGHIEPDIAVSQKSQTYKQPAQVFWNCGEACPRPFTLLSDAAIGQLSEPLAGRGLASADIDGDGDLDLAVSEINGKLRLFRNEQTTGNHWLRIKLRTENGNKNAIGALVDLSANAIHQRQMLMPTRSYVSQNEMILTFGLGKSTKVDYIKITWPDGVIQEIYDTPINQLIVIDEQQTNASIR